jgi:hypothetical protein
MPPEAVSACQGCASRPKLVLVMRMKFEKAKQRVAHPLHKT